MEFLSKLRLFYVPVPGLIEVVVSSTAVPIADVLFMKVVARSFLLSATLGLTTFDLTLSSPRAVSQDSDPRPEQTQTDTAPKAPGPKALDKDPAQPHAEDLSLKDPTSYVKPLSLGQYILEFNRSPVMAIVCNSMASMTKREFSSPVRAISRLRA